VNGGALFEIILLITGFIILMFISRKSIRSLKSHGLYRLVAWMGLWGMLLLNWRFWFQDPFSIMQIISWVSLVISLILLGSSVAGLRQAGKPDESRADDTLLGIEKTTQLVTGGIYRYIRHPMYGSLLFLGIGIFFKSLTLWSSSLLALVIIFLYLTALVEEQENIQFFGKEYVIYMRKTKRFIPFIW
jgi:protein-S-isoprenylcysteine O-methyltransferase Ste14